MKLITYLFLLSTFLLMVGCCGDKQEQSMSITVNLRYTGTDGNARKFAKEMVSGGTVDAIRDEEFDTLEALCYAFSRDPKQIKDYLFRRGFVWSEQQKQFKPIGYDQWITKVC